VTRVTFLLGLAWQPNIFCLVVDEKLTPISKLLFSPITGTSLFYFIFYITVGNFVN